MVPSLTPLLLPRVGGWTDASGLVISLVCGYVIDSVYRGALYIVGLPTGYRDGAVPSFAADLVGTLVSQGTQVTRCRSLLSCPF